MSEAIPLEHVAGDFLDTLWQDTTGVVYVATKTLESQIWHQHFFEWPSQRTEVLTFIETNTPTLEVYVAPSIFTAKKATKQHVKGSHYVWLELDPEGMPIPSPENLPHGIPAPSIRVKSGGPGHEHWYWALEEFSDLGTVEKINRGLTYALGADTSGWDGNQVLRPPGTLNHKRGGVGVSVDACNFDSKFSSGSFGNLPEPPTVGVIPTPEAIPEVLDVIARYPFTKSMWTLFRQGVPDGDNQSNGGGRGHALMSFCYSCAELKMSDPEIFSLLLNADERWGKFKERADRFQRLMEMITRARLKYPLNEEEDDFDAPIDLTPYGLLDLLKTEVHLEWVMEGLLHKEGYLLITGPSGIGKTQFTLDAAMHLALGRNYLGRTVDKPHKIGFFSLEMGLTDLKYFVEFQSQAYSPEERAILQENLIMFPVGEPLYLNSPTERKRIEQLVEEHSFDGVIFDSLGSVTEESLSNEEDIKRLMGWNDRLRKKKGIFTWFIHHHRKATGDNKKPNKLADVYGSQYITARATTVLCLWNLGIPNALQVIMLKLRLAPPVEPFPIYRNAKLQFVNAKSGVALLEEKASPHELTLDMDDSLSISAGDGTAPFSGAMDI